MAEWYERWFGEDYLSLYPHRDERDAAAAVGLLERELAGRLHERILDLACGSGRHTRLLRHLGWSVGLDLSPVLLQVARANDANGPYVRADMRILPFADGSFSLITNLFTSFGYFESDDEHAVVLAEVHRVLRVGGTFVLDYLNAPNVRRTLVPLDEREVNGSVVEQRRFITQDDRFVVKRVTSRSDGRSFEERVRLFGADDLRAMFLLAGFSVAEEFGDYEGAPLSPDSPRAILFAERA
ncbi:MAG TPA: methyltransferase domain-containing protein [Gemmatimonadaceae bacterium]|nr:methyltransferase domain-containing protein [Gemmatimonadaceae bacterium]